MELGEKLKNLLLYSFFFSVFSEKPYKVVNLILKEMERVLITVTSVRLTLIDMYGFKGYQ